MERAKVLSILNLLDDPDESVFDGIKNVIVENFGDFSGLLTQRLYSKNCSEIEKTRISTIAQMSLSRIFLIDFQNYTAKLSPEPSLLAGIVMIEKITDNTFDSYDFSQYIHYLSRKVWLKLGDNTGLESVGIIREVFETENIYEEKKAGTMLNGIFSKEKKPMHSLLINAILLIICQENGINIRPIITPRKDDSSMSIGYVNMELAKASNIPSKHGAIFSIDSNLHIERNAAILLGKPLPYYKYLRYWQGSRCANMQVSKNNYPAHYWKIMENINDVLDKNIKY